MAEDDVDMSLLVPLGFIALSVWTATWGGSLLAFFSSLRSSSTSSSSVPSEAAADSKNGSGKKKKKAKGNAPAEAPEPATPIATGDRWKAIILIISWIMFLVYLNSDYGMGQITGGSYDPYKILNVPESISKADLKKLYRDLSREYHPDRLAGKPEEDRLAAENQFVKISKAYKTLTTDEMMNNWLTYGHPDGPRSRSFSLGIPTWMKKPENAGFVLAGYLALFGAGAGMLYNYGIGL